jgi:hypothetical protein
MTTNDVSANLLHSTEHDLCSTVRNLDDLIAKPEVQRRVQHLHDIVDQILTFWIKFDV